MISLKQCRFSPIWRNKRIPGFSSERFRFQDGFERRRNDVHASRGNMADSSKSPGIDLSLIFLFIVTRAQKASQFSLKITGMLGNFPFLALREILYDFSNRFQLHPLARIYFNLNFLKSSVLPFEFSFINFSNIHSTNLRIYFSLYKFS